MIDPKRVAPPRLASLMVSDERFVSSLKWGLVDVSTAHASTQYWCWMLYLEINRSSVCFFFQYDQIKEVLIIMKREINKLLAWHETLFDGLFQDRIDISKQLIPREEIPKDHKGGKMSLLISFKEQLHRLWQVTT